jgi:hypothetical protein
MIREFRKFREIREKRYPPSLNSLKTQPPLAHYPIFRQSGADVVMT